MVLRIQGDRMYIEGHMRKKHATKNLRQSQIAPAEYRGGELELMAKGEKSC